MKYRIAFLATLFLAGAAMATPTTGEAPVSGGDELAAGWDLESFEAPAGYALGALDIAPEHVELAVYWPCGCIPQPGCPMPIPWPRPPLPMPLPTPFPIPFPCPVPF